jgi:ribulose kinase
MKQINGTGNGSVVTIAQRRSLDGFCVTKESAKPYPIDFRNQYGGQECAGKALQLLIHEHDYRRTIHIYSEKGASRIRTSISDLLVEHGYWCSDCISQTKSAE